MRNFYASKANKMRPNIMTGCSDKSPGSARYLFTNKVLIFIFLMLPTVSIVPQVIRCTNASMHVKASPCCSFPCKNGGSCMETCQGYKCDCTGTNHYGRNCEIEHMGHKLKKSIWAAAIKLGLTNFVTDMRLVQYEPKFSKDHGGFCNENFNVCREPMLLSPVPEHCPTPLGISGFQILPPIESLFDLVLKRRCSMEQTTSTTNLLFVVFAQFLANQMWTCTNSNWIGSSAMYGSFARTGLCGKVSKQHSDRYGNIYQNVFTDAFQSIILLEHNRVCHLLSQEHPKWNDHRLFETATLIVTGEILTIASAEWLPQLHDFGGTLNKKSSYPYAVSNRVPKEMKLAFLWPQMFPDSVSIEGSNIDLGILLNGVDTALPHGGHYQLMKFLATTAPGKVGPQNVPTDMEELTKKLIMEGRKWKFQSFNNYREYLGLGRISSFTKFTSNNIIKKHLEKMYGDINGLELIPGLLLETSKKGELLGETTITLISNMIFKGVVTHRLNTIPFNKKFTFGGKTGWNIVKNAKIHSLICNNAYGKRVCEKEGLISFKRKIHHPLHITSAAKLVDAEKTKKSTCCKKTAKTTKPVEKCLPLTPVKPACTKDRTKQTLADVLPKQPCSQKLKNNEVASNTPCAPPSDQCHMKAPPVEQRQPRTCTNKAEVKETACPEQAKKCCVKRPWFRTSTKKVAQNTPCAPAADQCHMKTPPVEETQQNTCTTKAEVKATACPQQVKKCCIKRPWFRTSTKKVSQNTPCAPLVGQCHMKTAPVEETLHKTCTTKPKVKATACPQQAKKCQEMRPWFRTSTKKVTQNTKLQKPSCAQKKTWAQKPDCAPKYVEINTKIEPNLGSTCRTRTKTSENPLPGKKCCAKRSWYRAWKG